MSKNEFVYLKIPSSKILDNINDIEPNDTLLIESGENIKKYFENEKNFNNDLEEKNKLGKGVYMCRCYSCIQFKIVVI